MPRRKPVPQPQQQLSETWAQDLTAQFRRTLSTKRMNDLSRRPASQRRTPSALPTEFIVEPRPTSQHSTQAPPPPSRQAPPVPGVLFIDEVHMLDIECFSFINRALEDELAPVVIMASNRGSTTIRGTNYRSPHGLPLDFLDRVVIISTQTYAAEEIKEILAIRAQEEEIDISADALALLTKIGAETGLRYAGNLLTTAHLIAKKRSPRGADAARPIEVGDVERVFRLFYDPSRSVKFVQEFEKRFIGEDGVVSLNNQTNGVSQGGDAMEVS